MNIPRRDFLKKAGALFAFGIHRSLTKGAVITVAASAATTAPAVATATTAVAAGAYGAGVRAQVFEVIVRQGVAGAPWREICRGPMKVNNISDAEVEAEIQRRLAIPCNGNAECSCHNCYRRRAIELYASRERRASNQNNG